MYKEKVSALLVTKDISRLVVIGKNHEYVFLLDGQAKALVRSPYRNLIRLGFVFYVAPDNSTRAEYHVHLDQDISSRYRKEAMDIGFVDNGLMGLNMVGKLDGHRYESGSIPIADVKYEKIRYASEFGVFKDPNAKVKATNGAFSSAGNILRGSALAIVLTPIFVGEVIQNNHYLEHR